MVEDTISKRKTPSKISFCKDKRFYEYQSQAKFAKKKCDHFGFLNRFFQEKGSPSHEHLQTIESTFKRISKPVEDDLGLLFDVRKENLPDLPTFARNVTEQGTYRLRLEEIYAMLIKKLKSNA